MSASPATSGRGRLLVIGVVVLAAIVVGGWMWWGRQPPPSGMTFGLVVSQTGPNAEYGLKVKRGIELAASDFEREHPDSRVRLVVEDSQSQVGSGLAAFRKLTEVDGVRVVFGNASFLAKAIGPEADDQKVLFIGLGTSAPDVTTGRQYMLRHFPHAAITTREIAAYAAPRYHRVAIGSLEDEYGKGAAIAFERAFTERGGQVVSRESFPQGADTATLRNTTLALLKDKPDAVFLPAYGPSFLNLLRAVREQSPTTPILGDINVTNAGVLKAAGPAADGMVTPAFDLDGGIATTPAQKQFLEFYTQRFHEPPDMYVFTAYDAATAVFRAAREVGGDPQAIRQAVLTAKEWTALSGPVRYDDTGDTVMAVRLFRISGEKLVPITP